MAVLNEQLLKRYRAQLELLAKNRFALESHLLDPTFLSLACRFFNLTATCLMRLIDPHGAGYERFSSTSRHNCPQRACVVYHLHRMHQLCTLAYPNLSWKISWTFTSLYLGMRISLGTVIP